MPQLAIAAAAAGIATSATVIGALGTFGATLAAGAFTITMNTVLARRAQRKAQAAANAAMKDRTQIVRSAIQPRNMILGEDRTSGPLACWFTWGDKRQYHTFAVVLAGHQCHAVPTYYFNDDELTLDGDGWVTAPAKYTRSVSATHAQSFAGGTAGTILTLDNTPAAIVSVISTTGDGSSENPGEQAEEAYTLSGDEVTLTGDTSGKTVIVNYSASSSGALFKIKTYLGAAGQTAAPELIAAATAAGEPDAWTSAHVGTGICYCTVQMEADFDVLADIGAPNVSARVQGAICYDPRTSSWGWSQNPALQALWYLYGSGYAPATALTEINADELIASANVCDETVDFSASVSAARYTGNGQVSTDTNPMDILGHILDAMDGDAVWVSGQWVITAGYHRAPSLAITEATLSSAPITIRPSPAKRDLFNALTGTYVDPAKGYVRTSYPLVTSSTYQTQDGGEVLQADASFELVNDPLRCQMIAWQRLTRARQGLTITLGTTLGAYDTYPTRTLTLQAAELGITTAQTFVVESRVLNGPTLEYQLQETGAAVWDWDYATATEPVDLPGVSLPDTSTIDQVEILAVESGAAWAVTNADGSVWSRINVSWVPVAQASVTQGGKIEIQLRTDLADADAWVTVATVPGDSTAYTSGPVPPGAFGLIRARAMTAGGRNGPWSDVVSHLVSGATQVPANYDTFAVTTRADGTRVFSFAYTSAATPADLAGAMIRWLYEPATGTEAWADLGELNSGPVLASPVELRLGDAGDYRFAVRSITRSGVLCAVADTRYVNVTLPAIGNPAAELLTLSTPWAQMAFDSAGNPYPAPQTLEFVAQLQNLTGTVSWSAEAFDELGASQGAVTLGGSGNTATMTSAQFAVTSSVAYVTITATLGTHTAIGRVIRITDGQEPLITVLNPPTVSLPASSDGIVTSWATAAGQYLVFQGFAQITTGLTYSIQANPSALTASINASTGAWSITGAGSWANASLATTITFRAALTDAPTVYRDLVLTITKAPAGADGSDGSNAKALALSASGAIFNIDVAGAGSPAGQSVTLTATGQNLAGSPSFSATAYTDTGSQVGTTGGITLTGSGSSRTLTESNFMRPGGSLNNAVDYVIVTVTQDGLTDTVRINRVTTGLRLFLTNDAHTVPASSSGTVSSWTGASGEFQVWYNATRITSGVTYAVQSLSGAATLNGGGTVINASTGAYSITAATGFTGDVMTITFRATHTDSGQYADLTFSITKSKAGADGAAGATGATGQRSPLSLSSLSVSPSQFGSVSGASVAWSDSIASKIVYNFLGNAGTPPSNAHLLITDTVTLLSANPQTAGVSPVTRTWNGSSWIDPGQVIPGNLLVQGSVSAGALAANSITVDKLQSGSSGSVGTGVSFGLGTPWDVAGVGNLTAVVGRASDATKFAGAFTQTATNGYAVVAAAVAGTGGAILAYGGWNSTTNAATNSAVLGASTAGGVFANGSTYVASFGIAAGEGGNVAYTSGLTKYETSMGVVGWAARMRYITSGGTTQEEVKFCDNGYAIDVVTGGMRVRSGAASFDGAVGFNGATAQTRQSVGGAATDAASTQTLVNNLRTALLNIGICQT